MKLSLSEWQETLKPLNDLIIAASRVDLSDLINDFPIGFCHNFLKSNHELSKVQLGKHENLLLCAFNPNTDIRRGGLKINRMIIEENLKKNGIENKLIENTEYYNILPSYKFVICPEGQGLDTHRTYEALMAGCIPIVEDNQHIKKIYGNCPILYTKDYSEITFEYLSQKYEEMKNLVYDFSNLFLSSYNSEQQIKIKTRSNFHCFRNLNKLYYTDHIIQKIENEKKLLFVHVCGEQYIKLYNLFIQTVKYELDDNTDILIITTEQYQKDLELVNRLYNIKAFFHITKYTCKLGNYSGKLDIVDWENINNYNKIIYTDIDILFLPNSINILFDTIKEKDIVYVVPENYHFTAPYFFHKDIYSIEEAKMLCSIGFVRGINTGIWGWNNYSNCKVYNQLKQIRQNIENKGDSIETSAAEQPFINHRFLVDGNFDFSFGYYTTLEPEKIIAESYKNYKNNLATSMAIHYTYLDKYKRMYNHLPFILYLCSIFKQSKDRVI